MNVKKTSEQNGNPMESHDELKPDTGGGSFSFSPSVVFFGCLFGEMGDLVFLSTWNQTSKWFFFHRKSGILDKVADLSPYTFSETKSQMVPMDLNMVSTVWRLWFRAKSTSLLEDHFLCKGGLPFSKAGRCPYEFPGDCNCRWKGSKQIARLPLKLGRVRGVYGSCV